MPEYIEKNRDRIDEKTSLGDYLLSKFEEELKLDEYKEATQTELEHIYGIFAWRSDLFTFFGVWSIN